MVRRSTKYECARCGACCVYFKVYHTGTEEEKNPIYAIIPNPPFKNAGEVCFHLGYNFKTRKARCRLYRYRPNQCREFICTEMDNTEIRKELEEFARKMPEIMREHLSKLEK